MSAPTPREAADTIREVVETYAREPIPMGDGSREVAMISRIDVESHEKLDRALTALASAATDPVAIDRAAAFDSRCGEPHGGPAGDPLGSLRELRSTYAVKVSVSSETPWHWWLTSGGELATDGEVRAMVREWHPDVQTYLHSHCTSDPATGGDLATQDRRAAGSLAAAYRRGYRDAWPDIAPEPVIVVPDDLAVPVTGEGGWALPLGDHPTRSEQDAPTTRDGWAALLGECIDALPGDTRTDIAVKLAKLRRVLAGAPRAEGAGPDAP